MNADILQPLAEKVGTPFWICDAALLHERIAAIKLLTEGEGLQARYAMKACPATRILKEMLEAGIWIDAVSGNEVLRARRAGFRARRSCTRATCFAMGPSRSCASTV